MRAILLITLLCFSTCVRGQELVKSNWIVGPSIAYQYQGKNFLKASLWALKDVGYANYLRLDAGANMTFEDKKVYFIPEAGVTYYLSAKGIWPFIKGEITPFTITPKIGLGIFNILEAGVGYGFELSQREALPSIKGVNFSLGISIPLNYHLK